MENLDENDKEHIKKHPSKPRRLHSSSKVIKEIQVNTELDSGHVHFKEISFE